MTTVSKLAVGAAVALAMTIVPAFADGYEKKVASYSPAAPSCDAHKFGGFYLGVHGGAGTMTSEVTDYDYAVAFPGVSNVQANDGWVLGGQMGYNFARCNTVFGVEADFSWSNIDNTNYYDQFNNAYVPFSVSNSVDWLGSLRTKAGIAMGDMFIYATGGLAFAKIQSHLINEYGFGFSSSDTRFGWVGGVGTEYAISDRVRLTGDLLYYDFGTEQSTDNAGIGYRMDDHHSLWVTRIGLNFKLGGESSSYQPMK